MHADLSHQDCMQPKSVGGPPSAKVSSMHAEPFETRLHDSRLYAGYLKTGCGHRRANERPARKAPAARYVAVQEAAPRRQAPSTPRISEARSPSPRPRADDYLIGDAGEQAGDGYIEEIPNPTSSQPSPFAAYAEPLEGVLHWAGLDKRV